jgi:hypothetical protein
MAQSQTPFEQGQSRPIPSRILLKNWDKPFAKNKNPLRSLAVSLSKIPDQIAYVPKCKAGNRYRNSSEGKGFFCDNLLNFSSHCTITIIRKNEACIPVSAEIA